jgi:hypothetical protein
MERFYRAPFIFILAILATLLCGCPPLQHKIFVRNLSNDTAQITLIYKAPFDTISRKSIPVRATHEIVPIKRKSYPRFRDTLMAYADNGKVTLIIPPKSTVFVSDILKSFYMFANKSLIIEHAGKSDTMEANYPYKQLKDFKRKFDPSYNYFYRTIVYYDIK